MCDTENQALMIMYDTLTDNNVEVAALVFDGLMIYKKDVQDLDKLLSLCEQEISKKMGCRIKLAEKIMDEGYEDIPVSCFQKRHTNTPKVVLEQTPVFYPFFIVYGFEAILAKKGTNKTDHFVIEQEHIPVSMAIHSNFGKKPIYLVNKDPKRLIEDFVQELNNLRDLIIKDVSEKHLRQQTRKAWDNWINQVPVLGFNSGKYDLNLIKEHFVKVLADLGNLRGRKKRKQVHVSDNSRVQVP